MKKPACLFALILLPSVATAQPVNPHMSEPIGTVRQVYDGELFPDIQVNTFRNIDRLFSTRVVKHGTHVYPLPVGKPLGNLKFLSNGKNYDLYDYMSLNRVTGLLVLKNGKIALERYELGNTEKDALDVDVDCQVVHRQSGGRGSARWVHQEP